MQTEFIPVSANTQDLQYHRSVTQKWFLALVARTEKEALSTRSGSKLSGETGGPGTRLDLNRQVSCTNDPQGMYIVGPDGSAYGFTNDHGPEDITRFMDICLARYHARPPKPVTISEADKKSPFSIMAPATASVIQSFARIPDPPGTCSRLNKGTGRDFVWVYADEVTALVASGDTAARAGKAEYPLTPTIARRLARFHLVDDVRGTPDMWASDEVHQCAFTARTIRQVGTVRTVAFSGDFAMGTASGRHSYKGTLTGEMDVDARTQTVTRFRAFADGKAQGAGQFTPNEPPGLYRLEIGFREADSPFSRIVPPEEVATYNRDTRYRKP